MLKIFTRPVIKLLSSLGYDLIKKQNPFATNKAGNWLELLNIETILDVGANEGQFIQLINSVLPGKKIIAFEPIKACYDKLVANTKTLNVTAINCGLSDINGSSEINISQNFVSSSLLQIEDLTKDLYPDAKYINKQIVELKRLDDVVAGMQLSKNILLKICTHR